MGVRRGMNLPGNRAVKGFAVVIYALLIGLMAPSGGEIYAGDEKLPIFGSGPVQVRLYTDYFCTPCRELESHIEPLIVTLVRQGVIKVTFVDTPFHRFTPLYARCFLMANAAKGDLDHALRVRRLLFEAAANRYLTTEERLIELFRRESIPFREVNEKSVFDFFNACIRKDNIDATPSCVIVRNGKKEKFVGGADIVRALKAINP